MIATPISTHYRLAHEALAAGKHVLVEKPITASAAESEQLVAEADRLNRVLMVGHTFEYNPGGRGYQRDCIQRRVGRYLLHQCDAGQSGLVSAGYQCGVGPGAARRVHPALRVWG